MISDNKAEVPDAKKPRLDLPPPPPVPPVPPAPPLPPAPVHNGSYGTSELIAQMTARGVAKAPLGPTGPMGPSIGPLGPTPMGPGPMLGPMVTMAQPQIPMMQACRPMPQAPGGCMLPLPGPPATGKPIFLAAATAHIKPKSSKPGKQLAMEFVQSSKEKQAEMLKDPNVARAILQTLEGQGGANSATPLPVDPAAKSVEGKDALWTGVLTLARNGAKRLPARVTLHRGKVQEIEVAVRSAAQHTPAMLDIKHRVPFDEAARRIKSGSVLSLDPITPTDQKSFDEYIKYFKTKSRAGVARLEGNLALYLLPAGESPEVLKALYELNTHIPRNGSLLGIIGESGPVAAPAVSAPKEEPKTQAEEEKPEKKEQPKEGDDEAQNMSSKELMDLFTNPDLIAALLNDKEKTEGK